MTDRLFTPREVNRLIPRLTELMEAARDRHREATALQERLRADRARVAASGGELIDARDWKARAERLDGLGIEVRQLLQEIAALGRDTKDLEMGLVDFPGRGPAEAGGAIVNLCWKLGDRVVARTGVKDPQWIVLDEVAGVLVAVALTSWSGVALLWRALAALLLFRVFDIWKPGPVSRLEKLPGGLGIAADDVCAGAIANVVLQAGLLAHGRLSGTGV